MYKTAIIFATIVAIVLAFGIFSSVAVMTAYAQPSITIQSIRCILIQLPDHMGVGVGFVVSFQKDISSALKFPVAIFAPNGNLVLLAGADDIIVTIPSGGSGPSSVQISTNFPITPSTPAPGTYKRIAIPGGLPVSRTFNAPDCSTTNSPNTTITSAVDGNGGQVQNSSTTLSTSIQFTLTGTSASSIAGFECSLDGSTFSPCSSPTTINSLAAGVQHNFHVRAVDTSGNKDQTPASFSWNILTPIQGIQQLIQLKHSMNLDPVTDRTLDIRLDTASQFAQNNIKSGTCLQLNAFINQVQGASTAGHLTPAQAAQLIQGAQNVEKALGC